MTPNYIVPWSCCKLSSGSDCLVLKSTDTVNKIGCLTPLYNDLIRDNVRMFAAVMIGCLLIQVEAYQGPPAKYGRFYEVE